ncbi:hypothetical protein QUB30_07850 [Microcoleus sp. BROC3]
MQFRLKPELIPQLKAGKLDIVIASQKITLSDIECLLLFGPEIAKLSRGAKQPVKPLSDKGLSA